MEGQYIAFYLIFLALIGSLGFMGSDMATVEELETLPVLDDDVGIFGTIGYGFELIGYFLGFKGFTILGFPSYVSTSINIILNGILLYVIVRLARGGG